MRAEPNVFVDVPTAGKLARKQADYFHPDLLILAIWLVTAPFAAIDGAARAAPKEQVMAAAEVIKKAVTETGAAESIATRVNKLFEGRVRAPSILLFSSAIPRNGQNIDYQGLESFAVDAVLEIRSVSLRLGFGRIEADPPVGIEVAVETGFVRVPDGKMLFGRTFHYHSPCTHYRCTGSNYIPPDPDHTFFKLAADDAILLREILDRAYTKLSGEIFAFYRSAVKGRHYYQPYYRSRH